MEKYFTAEEVAEIFKVKRSTVWSWIRTGQMKAIKFGEYYRIHPDNIKEFEKSKSEQEGA